MKQFKIVVCLLFVGLIVITSCNDSSVIGSDIIGPDQPIVEVTELSLKATTVNGDSLQTYRTTNQLDSYICGYMEDPIFGKFESIVNTQLRLSRSLTLQDSLDMKNIGGGGTLDEVFLIVELADTFYGGLNEDQLVEVYLLDEAMDNNETYYSNDDFLAGDLLGSKMFTPTNPDTSIFYLGGTDGIEEIRPDQMEIPLNINHPIFREILFAGDEISLPYFADDAALLEVFNGLQIKVSGLAANGGLTIFDPVPASVSTPTVTGLYVKYTGVIGESELYTFNINENAAKMVNFTSDYAGSIVEPFIGEDKYAAGDSLFFVQGMSGINAKLEIQDASSLQGVIINKAEIEFTLAVLAEDDPILSNDPISQLLIGIKNADGELERLSDVDQAIIGGNIAIFGGTPIDVSDDPNNPIFKYRMNITAYLQELIDGEYENAEIYIYPAISAERPQRSVLFGPGHSEHPAKLYVTYTENQ